MKQRFICIGIGSAEEILEKPSQNIVAVVDRLCLRFQDISSHIALNVFYEGKDYALVFFWKHEVFFNIIFTGDSDLCYFARYDDLHKPLSQWCRASFEKFPFEDRYIPDALCALLDEKCGLDDPDHLLYLKVAAMIKPGEQIPIEC